MSSWHEVSTFEEMQRFLRVVGGFHDGVLKEVHWVNRDVVDESLSMTPYQLSDARVLVQRQWENPSAVELYFENVWSFHLDTVQFVYTSTAGTEPSSPDLGEPITLLWLKIGDSKATFERMLWRDASDWMGATPRFGPFTKPDAAPQ